MWRLFSMNIQIFLPLLITAFGVAFLIKLRFFFILHPIRCIKRFALATKEKGAFGALALSLAGTLGVGNIVGIAYGISVCGEGIVFWLIVSSVFSMVLKYAESAVCSLERTDDRGGIMFVIKKHFGRVSGFVSGAYALLILLLSLTMGSSLQLSSCVECLDSDKDSTIYLFSLFFVIAVIITTLGGAKRIVGLCKYAIPTAAIIYSAMTLGIIALNAQALPSLFKRIISSAFNFRAAGGGVSIFLLSKTVAEGFSRGLLSNEAGAGTSGMAHSRNVNTSPGAVGLFGICEVFLDTVVLCPLTAVAVLLSFGDKPILGSGAKIVKEALLPLGSFTSPLLFSCITLFAYSTVICWFYYGELAAGFISKKISKIYPFIFFFSLVSAVFIKTDFLIAASDIILLFLSLISLLAISKSSDRLVALSESEGLIIRRGYGRAALYRERRAERQARTPK